VGSEEAIISVMITSLLNIARRERDDMGIILLCQHGGIEKRTFFYRVEMFRSTGEIYGLKMKQAETALARDRT